MIDEAHERNLNIDFVLGLLKKIQKECVKADLLPFKVVITSATLEKEKFTRFFQNSPVIEIPERLYPVEIHYEKDFSVNFDYTKAAAKKVKEIVEQNKEGDILIFMPGQEEINKTIKEIESFNLTNIVLLPLYGQMTSEEQDKIFEKRIERKTIVATNIAETSVTVPGIRFVIDSELIRQKEFDPVTGIESLVTRYHSKSGCIQRSSRAGRISSGECWRLYSEDNFNSRKEFQIPEIQRSNLARVILLMKKKELKMLENLNLLINQKKNHLFKRLKCSKIWGHLIKTKRLLKLVN